MDKILTIIIPTYNMEKYLRHCLDSLIVPNMDKVEVLVINDGSKDSSSAIGHEYQEKYPQTFRVIDKENGNYGSCVNRGLKEATGKYVKVLDADDSFAKDAFNDFIDKLFKVDSDMILTDFVTVDEFGKETSRSIYSKSYPDMPQGVVFGFTDYLNQPNHTFYGQMHGFTYRTQLVQDMGYHQTEGISYTDQEWVFKPVTKVNTCTYLPIILYLYLVGREGQTIKNFDKSVMQLEKVIGSLIDFFYKYESTTHHCRKYLLGQIRFQLTKMYQHALYEKILSLETIRAFDASIKKYPEIYHLVDNVSDGFPLYFKYIVYWRKHQYKEIPTILKSISNVGKSLIPNLRRVKQLFR